ncbi:MAG: hypothetical protein K2H87_06235 [Duncaniella sp.]|nr:hypothetical protein [Duncaniella sp.]
METNQQFSLSRLWRVMHRYMVENRATLILGAALILALMLIIGAILGFQATEELAEAQVEAAATAYMCVTALACIIIASGLFATLNTPSGAVSFLTLPATPYEICLSRWIIAVPLCLAWCFACIFLAEAARIGIALMVRVETVYRVPLDLLFAHNMGLSIFPLLYVKGILTIQSFFLLGSILWRGQNLIKTIGAIGAIGVFLYLVSSGVTIACIYFGARIPFTFYLAPTAYFSGVLCYILIIFNYTLTLIRLREAEVIQRW